MIVTLRMYFLLLVERDGNWLVLLEPISLVTIITSNVLFQNEKHRRIKAGTNTELPYSRGFAHTGLWKLMRHPNYACEQAIWITFFFFSGSGSGNWLNGSLVGAVLLVLLFQGSADFSEGISNSKYETYKDYIKSTPRFFPKFW